MKNRDGKRQRREEKKKEDQRRESQKREDAAARKGRKVAKHYVFAMICGSGGSNSRLGKAADADSPGQMRADITFHFTTLLDLAFSTLHSCHHYATTNATATRLLYTKHTTPERQSHYTTTPAALHHTTVSSSGRGDRPGDHCNHCTRFPILKLPPPPSAVLLVRRKQTITS